MEGIFNFIRGLAEALFDAFAGAVGDHPVTTGFVVVMAIWVFYASQSKDFPVSVRGKSVYTFGPNRFLDALVLFIGTAIAANALGEIVSVIKWALSSIFGVGSVILSPFDSYPIIFTASFAILSGFALIGAMIVKKSIRGIFGTLSQVEILGLIVAVFLGTYIVTMIIGSALGTPST